MRDHPGAYRVTCYEPGVDPVRRLFVAGAVYDVFATVAVGLYTDWHNRVRVSPPDSAPPTRWHEQTMAGQPAVALS